MTTTYDYRDPSYGDEQSVRDELARVFDLCQGCRLCLSLCPTFPTLFDLVDAKDGAADQLSSAEQDRVVDECYQCKLCALKCPYLPPHEWQLDFPKLMLRASALRRRSGGLEGLRRAVSDQALGRTDAVGRVGVATADLTNRLLERRGSPLRLGMERLVGISANRLLPPFTRVRFTTWFRQHRASGPVGQDPSRRRRVALFPTCLVDYQRPEIGRALVRVYERNGIACDLVANARCCGAPFLHAGDHVAFVRQARRNLVHLAAAVRAGLPIVVPQPTCGYVLKRDYPEHLPSDTARLVAQETYDAAEYLWKLHEEGDGGLDLSFSGEVPSSIVYHAPCHLQAQRIGLRSRDLLKLTGAHVTVVAKCSGIDGTWGLRAEHEEVAMRQAAELATAIRETDADEIVGDCHLANTAITEQTGRAPIHPFQVLARAYGIAED